MTKFFFYDYFKNLNNVNKLNVNYSYNDGIYINTKIDELKENYIIQGKIINFDSNFHNILKKINNMNKAIKFSSNKKIYTVEQVFVNNYKNNELEKCWILH